MALEQRLIQSQKLILSPQLRQYLRLLQLPIMELRQAVEQELNENPVLEETASGNDGDVSLSNLSKEEPPPTEEEQTRELDFQNKLAAMDRIDEEFKEHLYPDIDTSDGEVKELSKRRDYQESIITKATTLADYLRWQLNLLNLSGRDTEIAEELIGNIDEDGYLRVELEEVAKNQSASAAEVERILKQLQSLEPAGIGARDLRETLLIQLERIVPRPELAIKIVSEHFNLLERKHFAEIGKKLDTHEDHIKAAFHQIAKLEPKPGRTYYSREPLNMSPDASVYPDEENPGSYKIEIHQESIPHLRISHLYREMLKDKKLDANTRSFLKTKMNSALWLMQSIAQRKSTLRSITEEILKAQDEFFERGFAYLKPLRLKDIAEKVGIHESTVSRAIAGKYIVTPQGTVPYRSFFSNKMETENGSMESQKSILERLRQLIQNEDKRKPLSDEKIVEMLRTDGIIIARRTVAKYRDLLKILPTHLRKER